MCLSSRPSYAASKSFYLHKLQVTDFKGSEEETFLQRNN
uniref:Uncharacterized protein n=1 Tax=Arundo donax TaxID=35708 RepID=A0A0A9F9K9_ARUDO